MEITNKQIKFDFDINTFNFYELFIKHLSSFGADNLNCLHLHVPKEFLPNKIVDVENDQALEFYKILYSIDKGYNLTNEEQNGVFLNTYKEFVFHLSSEIFKEKLVFQRKPTLRVHFPGNKSVGAFHRDRDYNHPVEEINIWIPITSVINTNSIWIESEFDKGDHSPVNLNYGQGIIFDSGLSHGNMINEENLTRLSFDFRVIPISSWKKISNKQLKTSVDQNLKLEIGDYYDLMV
ncbi:hypothetical protein N9C88_03545 [Candidatus Pseudothioglobus singularis]|nr:hypothetical protein [Candidatus Pseudothioglobus singularis]